jgi:copper chaperone CopZ
MATGTGIKTTLSGVHLCCGGCTDAADSALQSVPGVSSRCDMDQGTVTFTAPSLAAARAALKAFGAAGLYGEPDNPDLAMQPVGEIPAGIVHHQAVSGIHNCCDLCRDAIKAAIATVEGVSGDTATPQITSFEVTGAFSPAALIQALNAAGFNASLSA